MLYAFLRDNKKRMGLEDVSKMAIRASRAYQTNDAYKAVGNAFCDGVEVTLGKISTAKVVSSKSQLHDLLQKHVRGLIVKNILVQARGRETLLWITFNAETSKLDSWTVNGLR